jgi:hypothetical protein
MKQITLIVTLGLLILSACAIQPQAVASDVYGGGAPVVERIYAESMPMEAPMAMPTMGIAYEESKSFANYDASMPAQQDRLVIQNADLTIVVKDPKARMDAISAMAVRMGGFVVSSNMYETYAQNGEKFPEGSIVIRVLSKNLDSALIEIKDAVVEVQNENRSGQDVTDAYTDLESRLRNLESAEKQLDLIMAKAEKTEDVMMVFNQLTQIRGEIEVIKGQMQYYEQSAALSSISIRIIAEETIQPIEIGGWKPEGVARDAAQALINFMQGFVSFLIWVVIFVLPMLLIILLPLWLIFLGLRALLRRGKKPAPPAAS